MGLIEELLAATAGYTFSELSKSHPLRDAIDERINRSKQKVTLENLIDEYARQRGIYTQDSKLAHRLHQIATRYEEYDYEDLYDRR
jgi:FKBP-type peptidyl-prolyl cis-trans isomerase (trigger factor)